MPVAYTAFWLIFWSKNLKKKLKALQSELKWSQRMNDKRLHPREADAKMITAKKKKRKKEERQQVKTPEEYQICWTPTSMYMYDTFLLSIFVRMCRGVVVA